MPEMKPVAVADLSLDLGNYRTIRKKSEKAALEAMIETSPDRFWALADSLLRDGYLATEIVIVLKGDKGALIVKEGNRRIAALKLIHGILDTGTASIPRDIVQAIASVSDSWLKTNSVAPCAVYEASEATAVDRIVALAHGKGEKAGRDQWNAVARARHNRDHNKASEPALDLLEKYLRSGKNVTEREKTRWAGDYPLSVLEEAAKRLAPRLGFKTAAELAKAYPSVPDRDAFESIINDIGRQELRFEKIRDKSTDFALSYGLAAQPPQAGGKSASGSQGSGGSGGDSSTGKSGTSGKQSSTSSGKTKAAAASDPKSVKRLLRDFAPRGKKREKVEDLRQEAILLDVSKTPLAFCFVLRSMFEVSAKAYCGEHQIALTTSNGNDRKLVDVLRDVTSDLTKNNTDKAMTKELHGALTELAKSSGILSVTSLNQLIHYPKFSIVPSDLARLFNNIFPLLEQMNS